MEPLPGYDEWKQHDYSMYDTPMTEDYNPNYEDRDDLDALFQRKKVLDIRGVFC